MAGINTENALAILEEDGYDITIDALRKKTRSVISSLLHSLKVIPTENGLSRDWRGLAELAGLTSAQMPHSYPDPTEKVLIMWREWDCDNSTIKNLLCYLEKLDRFDIIDDIQSLIDEDIHLYKQNQSSYKKNIDLQVDEYILTGDDVKRFQQGLGPQYYDAFILYADEDINFATDLLTKMENEYNLRFCTKDRDLVGGALELEVITKLIAERCHRLIVVFSQSFFHSSANKFFLTFAQLIGIEQRCRKILPCVYGNCNIPAEFRIYYPLDTRRPGNFWDKLQDSIHLPDIPPSIQQPIPNGIAVPDVPEAVNQDNIRPAILNGHIPKPKKDGVKFNSMLELNKDAVTNEDVTLNPSSSSSNLSDINLKCEKPKNKYNWLKKLLNNKERSANNVIKKDKKNFWSRHKKHKIAVAN